MWFGKDLTRCARASGRREELEVLIRGIGRQEKEGTDQ